MKLNYRRVNLNDINEMQYIATIDVGIPAQFDSQFKVNEQTISKRLSQLMKCQSDDFFEVIVAENSKVIAYHFMTQFISQHGVAAASIDTIWVDPDYRKKGLARELKRRGEVWGKENKLDHISTFVHGKNISMQKLNENLGYELVGYKLRKKL